MKKNKVLAMVLSLVVLTGSLAACGGTSSKTSDDTMKETTSEATGDASQPVTIKMMFHGSNVTDDTEVLAAINEYVGEKINVTLEPIWGTWGDFDDKAVLAINGGDDIDIYFTCSWSKNEYNAFAKQGAYVRLDDPENNLIEKYASDLYATLPKVLTNGAMINGADGYGAYAVPGYKDIATQNCWDVNVALLEKYGYTVEDIKNTDFYGLGEILKTVKAGEGNDFYPLLIEGAVLERMVTGSVIVTGDSGSANLLSYYLNQDDVSAEGPYGQEILNKFATPEYQKFVTQVREYYNAGYIDPAMGNANQANDIRTAKQLTGEYLIGTQSYALGYELQASEERGFEVAMIPVTEPYVDTTSSQGAMMAISTASKNPEKAMMFLNLLNTDPYLMTLLNYGVEGVHYNLVDGLVVFTDKRADYSPWTNGVGNVTILPPTEAQGAGWWDEFKAYYGAAKETPILGWAFDNTDVQNEMGALANVAATYSLALSAGTVDPEVELPKFLEALEANGMQTYVDAANEQFDEFLQAK
ncbi:MAG: ABC transporter substrate-binding protein [Lachnospiraceae bacterium]